MSIEGFFNSVLIILYFTELLNLKKFLKHKKILTFWVSVGFLLFYLPSVPFFTLLLLNMFDTREMFPIIYYLTIIFHLWFGSMNEKENIFLIVSALLVLLILISLIVLFTVFQKKKNALVEE
tara:strand:- start:219 stop:584 length:366 start_codon:yes stop_codon:yes gene_type:complete